MFFHSQAVFQLCCQLVSPEQLKIQAGRGTITTTRGYTILPASTFTPICKLPVRRIVQRAILSLVARKETQYLSYTRQKGLHESLIITVHPIVMNHFYPPQRKRRYFLWSKRRITAHGNAF